MLACIAVHPSMSLTAPHFDKRSGPPARMRASRLTNDLAVTSRPGPRTLSRAIYSPRSMSARMSDLI